MERAGGPLVGRDRELEVVDRALGRLRQGYSSALALIGDAGIGKTRMLNEIARRADDGWVLARSSASEYDSSLPYGALVAALDPLVTSDALSEAVLPRPNPSYQVVLDQLFPSYRAADGFGSGAGDAPRHQVTQVIRFVLETLGGGRPHLLLLDDLHWADSASTSALAALVRRPPIRGVLMVLASRTRPAPTGLMAAVDQAVDNGHADRLELRALNAQDSRLLVNPRYPETQVRSLLEVSGGNPFYLEQLQRLSPSTDLSSFGVAPREELPPAVTAALTAELEMLDFRARCYLEGAAVAGASFDHDLASITADMDSDAAVAALDQLLARDLVRPTELSRVFQFRHPLLRQAVYQSAPGGWRMAAHGRCATALAERGETPAARAAHIEQSARHGDREAIDVLTAAGRDIRRSAPAEAARLFASALRLTPARPVSSQAVELRAELASAYASAGQFEDSRAMCLETLAQVSDPHGKTAIRLTATCASAEGWLGLHEQTHVRLTTAAAQLPLDESPEASGLFLQLAFDCLYRLDLGSMDLWSRRLRDSARAQHDQEGELLGAALLGLAQVLDGRADEARGTVDGATMLAKVADLEPNRKHSNGSTVLAGVEYCLDRYGAATERIDEALSTSAQAEHAELLGCYYWAGIIHRGRGALHHALEATDTAIEMARLGGSDRGLSAYLATRATVATALGDVPGALASADEAVMAIAHEARTLNAVSGHRVYAEALLAAGKAPAALQQLEACGDPSQLPVRWQPDIHALRALCHVALDDIDPATSAAAQALSVAETLALPTATGVAQYATAAVADAAGDLDAQAHARAAVEAFKGAGAVLEAARGQLLLGQILASADDTRPAVAELTAAAHTFDELSAHGYRNAAERDLRKLGTTRYRRSSPATKDGSPLATLTGREREVVALVCDGRTNPEIAAALFLSNKTVETHLRNAFHKLHVRSRMELARLVLRGPIRR